MIASTNHKLSCTTVAIALFTLLFANTALGIDVEHRRIAEIRVEGLDTVSEQLVRNQIRLQIDEPYSSDTVGQDLIRLRHLGRFDTIEVDVEQKDDNSLIVTYVFNEHPTLQGIAITGNKQMKESEIQDMILLQPGDPIDQHLIDRTIESIRQAYEKDGYFLTDVKYDQKKLENTNFLVFQIREGPRLKIKSIKFEGNKTFTAKQLQSKIKSTTNLFFLRKGELSRERLDQDVAALRQFYHDRGYLDAQVGRRIDIAPNQKDSAIVFFVDEGRLYTVANIRIVGNTIFSEQDILKTLTLKVGDVYSKQLQEKSIQTVLNRYGELGFLTPSEGGTTLVKIDDLFHPEEPTVDLLVDITEGKPYTVGKVTITGNQQTKDKVVFRQLRGLTPARPFERSGFNTSQKRLQEHPIFSEAHITVLGDPKQSSRDVVVQVKEQPTGSLSFGGGFGSDAGVFGTLSMEQKNFDIGDVPKSLDDLFKGKGFYGAGQYLSIHLEPGNEFSRYSVRFQEPYFLESNLFFDTSAFFFNMEREDWNEKRLGGLFGFGQRFGDVWSAKVNFRAEDITIADITPDTDGDPGPPAIPPKPNVPQDVKDVEGDNFLTSIGLTLTRDNTDSRMFPTQGSNFSGTLTQTHGDFIFTTITTRYRKYWTVEEDFHGRRSVLKFKNEIGYIFDPGDAPIFERFYAGGHSSFRGFKHRGLGPHDEVSGDPTGGYWKFLAHLEYSIPVYSDVLRTVIFTDTGTLDEEFSFSKYRVSVGAGVRIKLPLAILQAPFALDYAFPIVKEDGDETQSFSFALDLPF